MNWYLAVLKNYAGFSGRASRREYWMFTLINTIILVVLQILMGATMTPPDEFGQGGSLGFGYYLYMLYALATLIPSLAVAVRRLHDTDRSGWWILIGLVPLIGAIVLLVFFCQQGTQGDNRFGSDPLD